MTNCLHNLIIIIIIIIIIRGSVSGSVVLISWTADKRGRGGAYDQDFAVRDLVFLILMIHITNLHFIPPFS